MRRQYQADDFVDTRTGQRGRRLFDQGFGVLGAVGHDVVAGRTPLELGAHGIDLGLGALGERREPADGGVAPLQIGQLLGRGRTAAADPGVEGGDIGGSLRVPCA